jgi:hypothetical protein
MMHTPVVVGTYNASSVSSTAMNRLVVVVVVVVVVVGTYKYLL